MAAFVGGELTDSALPWVALHAAECRDCSLQLAAAVAEPELLSGRYKLLRKLGEGGMGVVCEADDLVLGERVALKLLRHELACDERALDYLKSEVKLSRQIGHAHVCRVFDLGSQSSPGKTLHFLSMELLRGPSLRSLLAHGALEPQLALKLADQVLCGLHAAHAVGVLHRDLKPDNILLRYPSPHEPHAVITDFGLARAFRAGQRHVTASRTLVGSAAYLAPEQVEEAPLTAASDVYSFGVVLFELFTGRQPFEGDTALGVALKRLHVQPPRPSKLQPALGQRYDAFILRCLARNPSERFHSAAEARAALQTLRKAPRARVYVPRTFSVLCTAGVMSLWISTAHDSICTMPPTAASGASRQLAQSASDARAGVLLSAAATRTPGSPQPADTSPFADALAATNAEPPPVSHSGDALGSRNAAPPSVEHGGDALGSRNAARPLVARRGDALGSRNAARPLVARRGDALGSRNVARPSVGHGGDALGSMIAAPPSVSHSGDALGSRNAARPLVARRGDALGSMIVARPSVGHGGDAFGSRHAAPPPVSHSGDALGSSNAAQPSVGYGGEALAATDAAPLVVAHGDSLAARNAAPPPVAHRAQVVTIEPHREANGGLPLTAAEPGTARSRSERSERLGAVTSARAGRAAELALVNHSLEPLVHRHGEALHVVLRAEAGAAQPGAADVLTPDGFLDPFAD